MKRVKLCFIIICNSLLLFGQYDSKLNLDSNNVFLKINMEKEYCFGCGIPIEVQLGCKESIELFDLNTGYLSFTLFTNEGIYSPPNYYLKAATGGWYRINTYTSEDMIDEAVFEEIQQDVISLKSNDKIIKEFDLLALIQSYPDPGKYSLLIKYEGQIKAIGNLNITIDYKQSMSKILDQLENNQLMNGISSLSMFYYLTGYKTWDDSLIFQYEIHYKEAANLKEWWNENKEIILYVESILNKDKYIDLLYDERIPHLLKLLESEELQIRKDAHRELCIITGNQNWMLGVNDTELDIKLRVEEVNIWWMENKRLIIWINKIITSS